MKSKSRKLSLIGTIFVSMLSVCSAGVSTFAWFQAQANVNITTSSTSTTISVAKPDEYTFYYFNGNGKSNYNALGSFNNDFTAVPSSSIENEITLWNGIYPTQSMVFAVVIENLDTSVSSANTVTMQINKFISNNTTKETNASHKRYVRQSNYVEINIGWAIDIYSLSSSSSNAYYQNIYEYSNGLPTKNFLNTSNSNSNGSSTGSNKTITDHFNYFYSSDDERDTGLNDTGNENKELTQTVTIFDNETAIASTMYYFFRVYYSNADIILFAEKDGDTDDDIIAPVDESSEDRYFAQSSSGTSNCYAGLTFALTDISITW